MTLSECTKLILILTFSTAALYLGTLEGRNLLLKSSPVLEKLLVEDLAHIATNHPQIGQIRSVQVQAAQGDSVALTWTQQLRGAFPTNDNGALILDVLVISDEVENKGQEEIEPETTQPGEYRAIVQMTFSEAATGNFHSEIARTYILR